MNEEPAKLHKTLGDTASFCDSFVCFFSLERCSFYASFQESSQEVNKVIMFLGEQHNDLTTSPPPPPLPIAAVLAPLIKVTEIAGHTPAVPTTAVSCQTGEQQSSEKPTVQEPKLFYFGLGHRECCFLFVIHITRLFVLVIGTHPQTQEAAKAKEAEITEAKNEIQLAKVAEAEAERLEAKAKVTKAETKVEEAEDQVKKNPDNEYWNTELKERREALKSANETLKLREETLKRREEIFCIYLRKSFMGGYGIFVWHGSFMGIFCLPFSLVLPLYYK